MAFNPKLRVVPHTYKRRGLGRDVAKWTFCIHFGPRCNGLTYNHGYSSYESALRAGERKLKQIKKEA